MKKALSVLLALTLALLMAACGNNDNSGNGNDGSDTPAGELPDEIVIGGLAPLTGENSFYGTGVYNGAQIAVDEINENGGINGKLIKYINYDEKGDPTEAINAYNRLLEDGIVALMGDVTTAPTLAVAEKAAQDGTPMITPSGTGAEITTIGDNIFRVCFTDPYQGELMADYASTELDAKTVAILYDSSSDYSSGIADAFEAKAEEMGMEVTAKEAYPEGNTDFNSQLTKIKQGTPDVIMAPCYYETAALIVTQAKELGIESTLLGPDGWDGVLKQVGEANASALEGSYYCSQYSRDNPSPELQTFIDTYRERFGEDENMFAVLGYEAVYALANAIEDANSVEADAIVNSLKNLQMQGLTGNIDFQGGNDPVRDAYIIQFTGGEEKVLGTHSAS